LRTLKRKPVGESSPAADADVLRGELHEGVRRAVGRLGQRDREVIVLRYLEQMEVDEIAATLRLARNTVEVRLHRARERLKLFLVDLK
jgi:RNA polymerase sigma-70 factor (ECF subfamily)